MSAKHTPGPWEWDGNPCSYDRDNEAPWLWQAPWKSRDSFPILSGSIKCGEEANARLIAAAPDLLESLQRLIATGLHEREYREIMSNPAHYARAAIAKATGEQA